MPLIRPEVQKVLKEAGLLKKESNSSNDKTIIETLLDSGLSDEALTDELTHLALHSQNEGLRLRAIETALKVKGALKDAPPVIPQFTIVIQNSSKDLKDTLGLSPTLFPRQSLSKNSEKSEETN